MAAPVTAAYISPIAGGDSYVNLSASALVKTGECHLIGIFVASSSGATIKVWDNTSAATTVLVNTFTAIAGTWYPLPFKCKTGCYVTITGTADITASFF